MSTDQTAAGQAAAGQTVAGQTVAGQTGLPAGGTTPPDPAEVLEVVRHVWRGHANGIEALGDGRDKACKRMTDAGVGFDEFAAGGETDRAAAWRDMLAREGKLNPAGGGLRDLVLGSADGTR